MKDRLFRLGKVILYGAVLIAVGTFSAYLGVRVAFRSTEVEVPRILGKSLDEARNELARAQLRLVVSGERYDLEAPHGVIISQHPAPGRRSKPERSVQVISSLGQRINPVPNLIGSTERAARLLAGQSGYELGVISRISRAGLERDAIIQQFPAPDSRESGNPRIDVLVSNPTELRFVMPDFSGQSLNRVTQLLERNGFSVPRIQYRTYAGVTPGSIVRQFPEAGNPVTRRDTINLEVAR